MDYAAVNEYCDYVLLGKTGMGKSTTGNKLLGIDDLESYSYTQHLPETLGNHRQQPIKFEEGQRGSVSSTTDKCQLISNDTLKVRVLDMPGFADDINRPDIIYSESRSNTVLSKNVQLVRDVVRIRMDKILKIGYLVYFLPVRGALEKCDGALQEEITVIHDVLGVKAFEHMVLVVTKSPFDDSGDISFDEKIAAQTKKVFCAAVKLACDIDLEESPPVVYIRVRDTGAHIREMLIHAKKPNAHLELMIKKEYQCAKCPAKLSSVEGSKYFLKLPDDLDSICHPIFVPKHSGFRKIVGGVVHIITLGIPYIFMEKSWPGFFNSEEKCIHCEREKGSAGCFPVGDKFDSEVCHGLIVEHALYSSV